MNNQEFKLDLFSLPKELKLLLVIIGMEYNPALKEEVGWLASDVDWERFLLLARHHRVYPIVYANLQKLDKRLIPADVFQALSIDYTNNTFQMLHLTRELVNISHLFQQNQIRFLTLKGPVLADHLYGDISLRTSKDLDLLVPPDDFDKAEAILINHGYIMDHDTVRVLNSREWKEYHITYTHPEKGIQIELHWKISYNLGEEPTFNELWERRRSHFIANSPIYILSSQDLFLYLVTHGARHGWFRLRWLADIDKLIRCNPDWKEALSLMKKHHCLHMGGQALILTTSLFHTPLTRELRLSTAGSYPQRLARDAMRFIIAGVNLHPKPDSAAMAADFKRYLYSLKTIRQKWMFIIIRVYPSADDAKMLPLPKAWHFLYIPLRPFLWFWRQLKRRVLT